MGVVIAGVSNAAAYFREGIFRCDELICARGFQLLSAPRSVLIAGEGAVLPERPDVFAVTVDADRGFDAVAVRGSAVLTCGMSGRNTVSMTSRTTDIITLSLNRSIVTLRGVCDPFELPIRYLQGTSEYDCMAAFAAAVMSGTVDDSRNI